MKIGLTREFVRLFSQITFQCCLLYTSDAADDRVSVDLGGVPLSELLTSDLEIMTPSSELIRGV